MFEEIGKWLVKHAEDEGMSDVAFRVAIIVLIFYALGVATKWFLDRRSVAAVRRKAIKESEKLALEAAEKHFQLLGIIHESRSKLEFSKQVLNDHLYQVHDAANRKYYTKTYAKRKECLEFFHLEFLAEFNVYIEKCEALLDTKRDQLFIDLQIVPAYKTIAKVVEGLNTPELLEKIGDKRPFLLKPETLVPIESFIRKRTSIFRRTRRRKLKGIRQQLQPHLREW